MSSNTNSKNKAMTWQALCLMAYTVVWGFGNTVNGFANQSRRFLDDSLPLLLHSVHVDGGGNGRDL